MVTLTPQASTSGATGAQIIIQTVHGNAMSVSVSLLKQIGIGRGLNNTQASTARSDDNRTNSLPCSN